MGLIKKIFGSSSEREIKKIMPLVRQIEELAPRFSAMSEEELRGMTASFRQRLDAGETLDDLLPEAFASVREAATRVLGMTHFEVQLIGGIILHQGRIAEMKTGEGKTLVATLPVYLNALAGKGVHIVTVNDYLARRDSEWMGKIYRYLGLSVGLVVHGISKEQKKAAYAADITYGTNNEFGFDYLRDNMVTRLEDKVQRELSFAIVDEVDSILIDEARTPLIISGSGTESSQLYVEAQRFVSGLRSKSFRKIDDKMDFDEAAELEGDADYIIDEKAKTAVLTPRGVEKAEAFFKVDQLTDQANYKLNHHINNALKANGIMHRDQDYVLRDGEVVIVDDFTGRLMEGRRYSNGLHQAIEAKEGVMVQNENRTLATITFQNYFRMYHKLSGMTGTAMTEEDEFREIYQLDVVEIPTNKPLIREDLPDAVYKTLRGKYQRVLEEVEKVHATGQPVLIGTISVERSEQLSELFTRAGLPHNVLNAKQHEREAEIVSQAGRLGAITISTNMAGRGTDIMLGGNPEYLAKQAMRKDGVLDEIIEEADSYYETDDLTILQAREIFQNYKRSFTEETDSEKEQVVAAGGLYIMGTERHESRRIDNQLRGRSGRQGDPGKSRFFLSLEDDLMRLFGGERMDRIFDSLGVEEDMEISHAMLSRGIESAQRRVEAQNFAIRKHVLEYDDVMNQQRELIYQQRSEVLEGRDIHDYYLRIIHEQVREVLLDFIGGEADSEKWDKEALATRMQDLLGDLPVLEQLRHGHKALDGEDLCEEITDAAIHLLEDKASELGGEEILREAERMVLLSCVDNNWMEHIDNMDTLRDSIGMRAYGQQDPVVAYKKEGFEMFEAMTREIQEDSLRLIMRAQIFEKNANSGLDERRLSEGRKGSASALQSARRAGSAGEKLPQSPQPPAEKLAPVKRDHFLGRNDPCWCGSGKKYKNCHMRSDQEGKS